ncbi:hypothetical protein OF83DRAFT_1174588 [Amylostereum chailletii]|nr:hypothetical protein OF83DRAFT_1174588 [Amylostereum chailletii]
MPPSITSSPASTRPLRHNPYYIQGGDVIFKVEMTLFRVHTHFFVNSESGSPVFRHRLAHLPAPPSAPPSACSGTADDNPYVLDDADAEEFCCFLWIFYNPQYSIYNATVREWTAILKLAHQWQFKEAKALAVRELEKLTIDPIEKVYLYQTYHVLPELLIPSYVHLTTRDDPLSLDEGERLGLKTALRIARAREFSRGQESPGGLLSPSPVRVSGPNLHSLLADLFKLPPPPPSVQTDGYVGTSGPMSAPLLSQPMKGQGPPLGTMKPGSIRKSASSSDAPPSYENGDGPDGEETVVEDVQATGKQNGAPGKGGKQNGAGGKGGRGGSMPFSFLGGKF